MKQLLIALITISSVINLNAQNLNQLSEPYVHYQFNNNLIDSKANSRLVLIPGPPGDGYNRENTTTGFGDDSGLPFWEWTSKKPRGGGFRIFINKDIGEEYTIMLKFSFNTVANKRWTKIIDYKNGIYDDSGFYFYYGKIYFYNFIKGNKFTNDNEVVTFLCTRSTSGRFRIYVVNESDWSVTPEVDLQNKNSATKTTMANVNGESVLGFFFDDTYTKDEATDRGKVYDIRIWDKYLESNEVETILTKGEVVVRYVDENDNDIANPDSSLGNDGIAYTTTPKNFKNCQLMRTPSNASGVYRKGTIIVVKYVYRCYAYINPSIMTLPEM